MRPIPCPNAIPRRSDQARITWDAWLRFVASIYQRYEYDDTSHRPYILRAIKRGHGAGRGHLNKSFLTEEHLIRFLRLNARELLTTSYVLQRDSDYLVALCRSEGHTVARTIVETGPKDHVGAHEAHRDHLHAAEVRFHYLWPGDLAEAARLWRDEANGTFPPPYEMYAGEMLARARAATLAGAMETSSALQSLRRERL
jgi:hypothetical protein